MRFIFKGCCLPTLKNKIKEGYLFLSKSLSWLCVLPHLPLSVTCSGPRNTPSPGTDTRTRRQSRPESLSNCSHLVGSRWNLDRPERALEADANQVFVFYFCFLFLCLGEGAGEEGFAGWGRRGGLGLKWVGGRRHFLSRMAMTFRLSLLG